MNENVKNSRWLCTHGTQDNVLPFQTSKNQVQVLQDNGFEIEFKAYNKDHSIDRDELEMISAWIKEIMRFVTKNR